jgi:hypothetical protein
MPYTGPALGVRPSFEPRHGKIRQGRRIDLKPSSRAGRRIGSQPHRTSPVATSTRNAKSDGLYKAATRAVMWGVGRPLSRPGMTYWMTACSVFLYIVMLGLNIRFCRESRGLPGKEPFSGISIVQGCNVGTCASAAILTTNRLTARGGLAPDRCHAAGTRRGQVGAPEELVQFDHRKARSRRGGRRGSICRPRRGPR